MNIVQILKAMNSIMIGIGKQKNLAKDLEAIEQSGPWPYIIAGLIMTVLFIAVIILAVRFALMM